MWLAPAASPGLLDDNPPAVNYTIDGINGTNGWYRGSTGGNYVVVHWTVSDPDSPISATSGCEPAVRVDGPNTGTTRTCTATSDGGTTAVTTKSIKIDASAPTGVSAAPTRSPDVNGWYRNPVTINWNGSDATSGLATCTSLSYSGPDGASIAPSGACTDQAGNTSAPLTLPNPLKYDSTPPVFAPSPDRAPNANGWYRSPVTVSWNGSDKTSGIASCPGSTSYVGPDNASAAPSATCTDQAGNSASVSFAIKYDSTPPAAGSAAPTRAPDANGWYRNPVTINWNGSDATSGPVTCTSLSYSGPDGGSIAPSGTCTDQAGNTSAPLTLPNPIKYDSTAPVVSPTPSRAPDANGWYNHALTIGWVGSDPASGVDSCTASTDYNGPDNATASTSGTCTDKAGNTAAAVTYPFKFDATAPVVTSATAARPPDQSGWYNHPISITWAGTDSLSGIHGCTSSTYNGPDSNTAAASGTCTDAAGNRSPPLAFPLKFDATAPVISAAPGRATDANGWYNHAVTIDWSGTDATSGLAGCSSPLTYTGPDAVSVAPSGSCTDKAGNVGALAFPLRYDATAPVVSARPDRRPDHGGWYNHALSVQFLGEDGASGIGSCTSAKYGGAGGKRITSSGSCSDRAGNLGFGSFSIAYDAEPPTLASFAVESQAGADVVRWKPSSHDDVATVNRTARGRRTQTVYRGAGDSFVDKWIQAGTEYRYSVQTQDQAGNESRRLSGLALPKAVTLRNRGYVPRTAGPPILRLPAVAGATYYHVQLFRHRKRILAAWPVRPQLGLHASWKWAGRSYHLTQGRYKWFAWAGFGRRSAARYKLLGSAEVVVAGR
jgi:hypothetical protein